MDFSEILSLAQQNDRVNKSKEIGGYKTELSAVKREKHDKSDRDKPRSQVVQKLIDEKRREKEEAERSKHKDKKHEHRHHHHKSSSEKDKSSSQSSEKDKNFKIPKKKEIDTLLKDLDSDDEVSDSINDKTDRHVNEHRENGSKTDHKHTNHKSSKYKTDYSEHKGENHDKNKNQSGKSESKHRDHSGKSESKHRDQSSKNHSDHRSSDSKSSSKHSSSSGSKSSHDDRGSSSHKDKKSSSSTSSKHSSLLSNKHSSSSSSKHPSNINSMSSSKHSSNSSSSSNKHSSSSSGSKDKDKHSSHRDSEHKSSSSHKSEKKKPKELSIEELREQVKRMKDEEAMIAKQEEKQELQPVASDLPKNRTGLVGDEAEARKAKILSRTQMILERTKAKFAEQKQNERQPRQKGRRSNENQHRSSGKEGDKIKSRSVIKDDDDDSDDDPNATMDMSSNQELMKTESGDILKNIKKKIDEKLGDYNFPDRPAKERKERASSSRISSASAKREEIRMKHKQKLDKSREKHKNKIRDREKEKREKIKEMMRKDYKSNFSGNSGEQPKPKRPVIVRRFQQQQPPPMSFNDLLKLAENKSKESHPEITVIKPKPPKKTEERLLTQEELDRRKRAEEVKRRRQEEESMYQKGSPSMNDKKLPVNSAALKSKSDSSLLKGALTGKPVSSQSNLNSKQKVTDKKPTKYDAENESVLVCKPSSSSNVKKAPPTDTATNPWDRIYGQIQQRNPKAEKRKRPILESSDEEDEYDEDDDFIDDGDCGEDYSAHIRSIFGYDKRKYKFEDEDDIDNMEANFATVMKEEARSAKIGKMEDLEDIRKEQEELRLKQLAKKKKMKR